jgi:ribonucleoside-diphosphate reductase alpha subunit
MSTGSYVTKRDGRKENVIFDKISSRIQKLCYGLDPIYVDHIAISQKVIQGIYPGVTTSELDELAAQTAAYMSVNHPDLSTLAARIAVSNLHKSTNDTFSKTIIDLYDYGMIADDVYKIVCENSKILDDEINTDLDFEYEYFGFKTLEKSYLLKIDGRIVERPQYMLMRVAVGIHKCDLESVLETYRNLSNKYYTHATPTLFNAGTKKNQMSSCYLLAMQDDSIDGIFDTLKQCAQISKYAGGIGLSTSNVRSSGSYIAGTNGISNGLVPMLQCFNSCARYVDQGGGRRKGSIAIYLEPWHADVFAFLDLKKNHGNELERARDLFYAMWVPDLFMQRVKDNGKWTLFCPSKTSDLIDLCGDDFKKAYEKYEEDGVGKSIQARTLWDKIIESQIETGTPYMLSKDACNAKSNQKNLGTIRSSNLCAEIVQYSSKDEIAVCNLSSINCSKFVVDGEFDFVKLHEIAREMCKNLNRVIDVNFYPVPATKKSNMKHRPIGVGVQDLHGAFMKLGFPFESKEAADLNSKIFETIYHGCVEMSIELAKEDGHYDSYEGSPASEGKLQFDLWGVEQGNDRYDWTLIKENMAKYGLRNSLLTCIMPTASSATFCSAGTEGVECSTAVMYSRRVLSGDFPVLNKYLVHDLIEMGLWNSDMKNKIMACGGSIQKITEIPDKTRELYKNVWEISQKTIIDQASDRGRYICQSQSMNCFMESPSVSKLSSFLFYGWSKGLKTLSYYIRSRPVADAIKFTVDSSTTVPYSNQEDEDECVGCSA